jgi:hypothetical protein
MPLLETIQKWAETAEPVYVEDISAREDEFEREISNIRIIHTLIRGKEEHDIRFIIFHGRAVSSILWMALDGNVKKAYWADTKEHFYEITSFLGILEDLQDFRRACCDADEALFFLSEFIKHKTGRALSGEDAYWRKVSARNRWGHKSEAEIVLRQIAIEITRAGVLRRIDLEDEPIELQNATAQVDN